MLFQQPRGEGFVGKHVLRAGLAVVEVAAHAPHLHVLPRWVAICLNWMSLTPPSGYMTPMDTPSASRKPSSAALPVSPDVATRIMKSWSSLPCSRSCAALAEKNFGRHCSAMSLNALVGPCHSSSTWVLAVSEVMGQMRSSSKLSP